MATLGQAYVQIMPSAKGISGSIQKIIQPEATSAGKSAGSTIASSMAQTMGSVGGKLTKAITLPVAGAATAVGGLVGALGFKRLVGLDTAQAKLKGLGYNGKEVERISGQVENAIAGGMTTMGEGVSIAAGGLAAGVKEGKDLEKYISLVGDAAVGAGRPVDEMAQIFNRVQGGGRLMTQELNMIEMGLPGFAQAMADELAGGSLEAFREMVTNGEVGSDDFLKVMDSFAGGMADAYSESWAGMAKNTLAYVGIIGEALLEGIFEDGKEGLANLIELLKSDEIQTWAVQTGEKIREVVSTITEVVKSVFDWFTGLSSGAQKFIGIVAGLAVAIGPILLVASKIMTTIMTLMPLFKALGVVIGALTSPIGLIVAAVIGAAALIIVYWEPIKEFFINLWESIKEMGIQIWENLTESWLETVELFKEIWSGIGEFFSELWEGIKELGLQIWENLTESWQETVELLKEMWTGVAEFFSDLWNGIKELGIQIWDNLTESWRETVELLKSIWGTITEFFSMLWEGVKTIFTTVWNAIKEIVTTAVNGMKTIISTVFTAIKTFLSTALTGYQNIFTTVWNAIKNIVTTVLNGIRTTVSTIFNAIKSVITSVLNGIRTTVSSVWNGIRTVISSVLNGIRSVVSSVFNSIRSVISSIMNGIRSTVSSVWNGIRSVITSVANGIRSTISSVFSSLSGIVTGAMSGVRNAITSGMRGALNVVTNIGGQFKAAGSKIVSMIADGIKAAAGKVTGAAKDLMGKVRNFLPFSPAKDGPLRDLDKLNFGGTISMGIDDGTDEVQKAMNNMLTVPNKPVISKNNSLNSSNNIALLKEQNSILMKILNKNTNLIMNDRVLAEEIEPALTEVQDRNKHINEEFI